MSPDSSFARENVRDSDQQLMALLQTNNKELNDKLEQAMAEVENLKREAFEESKRRLIAEKEALRATRKVDNVQITYSEESKKRAEIQEELIEMKKELDKVQRSYSEESKKRAEIQEELIEMKKDLEFLNSLLEKVTQELHEASNEKKSLENQLEKTYLSEQEMERKILSAVGLLQKYKNDHHKFQVLRDHAVQEANELKNQRDHAVQEANELKNQLAQRQLGSIFDFSYSDLHKATNSSDPALIIGEGGKGITYKGVLHHIDVAITFLSPNTFSGPQEFEQQVYVLSKLRHPNIVTLIGICSEPKALIYEYLSKGSLEDRLMCKDNTPPLPWKTRIQIATQLCSVLTFLHSRCPSSIIHGNLKPENILLNDSFVCKLHNFGPKILAAEELSPEADVYSFGIILLQLLTGKLAFGRLSEDVKDALDRDDLNVILDHSAGSLPYVQAKQLASMALRCCDMDLTVRPDLNTEVWRVLESMKASSHSLSRLPLDSEEQAPDHFKCPVSWEIMEDPHIAADGFTYEAQSIENWLKSGHNTSPLTNMKLANKVLIPNRSLRSAIGEWKQLCHTA